MSPNFDPAIYDRTPIMASEVPANLPTFRVDSPLLDQFHSIHAGFYRQYVVVHHGVAGSATFRSMNTVHIGQRSPAMRDIIEGV